MADITREVATGGFLLRAYGFKNQEIYNILESKAFDLTMFQPTSGAALTTPQQAGSKNLNKDLFTEKARKRAGGKRGAPSWLTSGNKLGDHLSQSLGFVDEAALDDFTLNAVGSMMAAQGKSMGMMTSKDTPQRNLMQTADWEWTENATLMAGGPIDEHSMSVALDAIKAGNNFDLASRVVGSPIVTPPPAPPPPASPAGTPSTPSTPPDDDDDDDDDDDGVSTRHDDDPLPTSASIPDDDADDDDIIVASGAMVGHKLLSPARPTLPVSDLPDPDKATRRLNKSVWDERVQRRVQDVFGDLEVLTGPGLFYPAIGPVCIKLPIAFANGVIPQKDISIRSKSTVLPFDTDWDDQTSDMILVLENGKSPYFYFEDQDEPPYFLKMSKSIAATDPAPLRTMKCLCQQLQINWSNPADGSSASIPLAIRFALKPSARGDVVRPYELELDGDIVDGARSYTFLPSLTDSKFSTTMKELVTQEGTASFEEEANELRQEVAAGYTNATYNPEEDLLLPIGDEIPNDELAGTFLETDTAPVLVYGIPDYGMAGLHLDPDGDFVFGASLIFANEGVKVYTSVDQYEGDAVGIYEGKFLANLPINWDIDSKVVWTVDNPPNVALKMQLQFRDSGATVSEYSGINPEDPKGPRVQALYLPGDIPNKIYPIALGSNGVELSKIAAHPKDATSVYERIRLTFVDADGNESHVEVPDANDRFTGSVTTATGNQAIITGEACLFRDSGEQGYIHLEEHLDYDTREFMQLIQEARTITRASPMNNLIAAPDGNVRGVKQVIWSEGRTLNVLMLKPGSEDEFIHLTIVTEKVGAGE